MGIFDAYSKSQRLILLESLYRAVQAQIQDLFKEIGALSAWRRRFSVQLGRFKEEIMGVREDLTNLRREVDEQKTVTAGAVTAIEGVSQLVKDLQARIDANPDMTSEEISAELGAMAAELDGSQKNLADAVANVPQAQPATSAPSAADRAAAEGNATIQQPNAPK